MKNADFELLAAVVEACKHFSIGKKFSVGNVKRKPPTKVC